MKIKSDVIARATGKWEKKEDDRNLQRCVNFIQWMEKVTGIDARNTAEYRHMKLEFERLGKPMPSKIANN